MSSAGLLTTERAEHSLPQRLVDIDILRSRSLPQSLPRTTATLRQSTAQAEYNSTNIAPHTTTGARTISTLPKHYHTFFCKSVQTTETVWQQGSYRNLICITHPIPINSLIQTYRQTLTTHSQSSAVTSHSGPSPALHSLPLPHITCLTL